jgi:hypothetical protein
MHGRDPICASDRAAIGRGTLVRDGTRHFELGYRAVTESSSEDAEPEDGEQSTKATGFPLASWRYVYDVDKAEASREMASVNQQANDLAEAEKKARQR